MTTEYLPRPQYVAQVLNEADSIKTLPARELGHLKLRNLDGVWPLPQPRERHRARLTLARLAPSAIFNLHLIGARPQIVAVAAAQASS